MLDPTLFGGDLENFPILWDNARPVTISDVLEEDPSSVFGFSDGYAYYY